MGNRDELLIKNVRPMGGESVDVLVSQGFIRQMAPDITLTSTSSQTLDGQNHLLLPGLVNAHAHIDKNLLGLPWHRNQVSGRRIRDYVDNERTVRRNLNLSANRQ
ncbi:MAG TPA: hypothetical protein VLA72_01840, partial [Anaerolineales bacterium]|nr:hypothetical protein [Anaerolineales bacterium]